MAIYSATRALQKSVVKSEKELMNSMLSVYNSELDSVEKKIASYYQKYGKNNVIEYQSMLNSMSESDRKMLFSDWDSFANKYPQYKGLLPVRDSIYTLNELEGLQMSMLLGQMELGAIEQSALANHLLNVGNMTVDGIHFQLPDGFKAPMFNSQLMASIIANPFMGSDWSSRIWKNKKAIADKMNSIVAVGFAKGTNFKDLTRQLAEFFSDTSYNNIYRLVFTEGSRVMNEVAARDFDDMGLDTYIISTANDAKVCSICSSMQSATESEPIKLKDRSPGDNFPPFHPWCRCRFKLVEPDDWNKWIDDKAGTKKSTIEELDNGLKSKDWHKDNFYSGTESHFKSVDKPNRKADYVSDSGSAYWYEGNGVVRGSDHWGSGVASCDWYLDSDLSSSFSDKSGRRYGYCNWSDFGFKMDFDLTIYGEGDSVDVMGNPFKAIRITPDMVNGGYVHYKGEKVRFSDTSFMDIQLGDGMP